MDGDDDIAVLCLENEGEGSLKEVRVSEEAAGQRLDRWLAEELQDVSRNRLQALIKAGHVRDAAGALVSDASIKVKQGAVYALTIPAPEPDRPIAQDIPLTIVYEDPHLIVVDKPAGLVVHPAPGHRDGTLVNALLYHCGESLSGIGGVRRPGIVHRIDKETSGLLVVAKTEKAHAGLSNLFAAHDIDRRYRAIVLGVPEPPRATIEAHIGRHPTDRIRFTTVSEESGRSAITHYRVLSQRDMAVALVECQLETGRTHQIRVHLSSAGHPLIGDKLYAKAPRTRRAALTRDQRDVIDGFKRQALHAATLGFEHPITGAMLAFEAPEPRDFKTLRESLGLAA